MRKLWQWMTAGPQEEQWIHNKYKYTQLVQNVAQQLRDTDALIVKKVDFVVFIVQVIHCNVKKLDTIVSVAARLLGIQELTTETLQGILTEDDPPPLPGA